MKFCKIPFIAFIVGLLCLSQCVSQSKVSKAREKIEAPYDGLQFSNLEPFEDKTLIDVLKWRFGYSGQSVPWPEKVPQSLFTPTKERSHPLQVAVIGHATALIQVDGLNILTDPQYSQRASPVSWAGPKRVIQPGIAFEDLPPIDVVVISHDHYDALDLPTLVKLQDAWAPRVYVGLGNGPLLRKHGIHDVVEMDWWDRLKFRSVDISYVPVQHWSARGIADRRETLWGGFVIHGTKRQIFFAGDTGYASGKVFRMIRRKLGPMDVSLIPIGAYEPRDFMKNAHVWPQESVQIFQDTDTKQALGIHFGTFAGLTSEGIDEPPKALREALQRAGVDERRFQVPVFGKTYSFP